eukprot:Skav204243  [mRNA]  locus=scaffold4267:41409:43419:+ [translate_table: standard]
MSDCVPSWSRHQLPCPYGLRVPLPASTFTLPQHTSLADWLAALICTLPFDWCLLCLVAILCCRGLREVFLGLLIVLLQNLLQQPRPKESCLTSCGMPSGHAVP